jgi:hypothetical protein
MLSRGIASLNFARLGRFGDFAKVGCELVLRSGKNRLLVHLKIRGYAKWTHCVFHKIGMNANVVHFATRLQWGISFTKHV